jgi:hypothetical protein
MKIFYFMGANPRNKSGVSWKFWQIERRGLTVRVQFGHAELKKRIVVPRGHVYELEKHFSTIAEARSYEMSRIASKERKGYERHPQPR